jgi:hypothetical protein
MILRLACERTVRGRAHASIELRAPADPYGYEGRGHSLWFCDALEAGRFSSFETGFMISSLMAQVESIRSLSTPARTRLEPSARA